MFTSANVGIIFGSCNIFEFIIHEMVGLMYELCAAVRTLLVLGQNIVWLTTQVMSTMGTSIIVLELTVQVVTLLRQFGGILIGFHKEHK